jgi:uncharacterized membrane protein
MAAWTTRTTRLTARPTASNEPHTNATIKKMENIAPKRSGLSSIAEKYNGCLGNQKLVDVALK